MYRGMAVSQNPAASAKTPATANPQRKTCFAEKISLSRPDSSMKAAKVKLYALNTHWDSLSAIPSSLAMAPSAGTAAEPLRISVKLAKQKRKRSDAL